MEEEANIGGYDNNAVIDARGVNMFSEWLMQAGGLFMPHFVYGDKVPNLDGRMEICELQNGKYVPVRSFYVQIKSFERDYINRNKKNQLSQYKYLCDTKIFNIVRRNVIMDPALLLLII